MATLNDRAILESIINPLLPNKFLTIEEQEQNEGEDQQLPEQGFHFKLKILAVMFTLTVNLFLLQMLVNM